MKNPPVKFSETFGQMPLRHLSEYKELMFTYSESRKACKVRYKEKLMNCYGSLDRARVINNYISELHELLIILNDDKWKLKYAQKEEWKYLLVV